jgi:hypothetical protein
MPVILWQKRSTRVDLDAFSPQNDLLYEKYIILPGHKQLAIRNGYLYVSYADIVHRFLRFDLPHRMVILSSMRLFCLPWADSSEANNRDVQPHRLIDAGF